MPSSSKCSLVVAGSKMGSKEDEVVKKVIHFYQKDQIDQILDHFENVTSKGTHAEQYALKNVLWPIPTRSDLEIMSNFLYSRDVRGLFSVGCGTGLLEWLITQFYEDCHYKAKFEFTAFENNDAGDSINDTGDSIKSDSINDTGDLISLDDSLLKNNVKNTQGTQIYKKNDNLNGIDSISEKIDENSKNVHGTSDLENKSEKSKVKSSANYEKENTETFLNKNEKIEDLDGDFEKSGNAEKKLSVKCIEVDSSWWESKYAPPVFHYLHYFGETFSLEELFGEQGDAILFSYFNSGDIFKKYLEKFLGSYVVLIGPVAKQYCDPSPLDLKENQDLPTADWDLILYQRFGLEDVDFIGIYERTSEHSNCQK